jgi:phenylacetate-CoA ligase
MRGFTASSVASDPTRAASGAEIRVDRLGAEQVVSRSARRRGTTEGLWGCECEEHAGIHLFDDVCLVENVDDEGRAVPAGELGARLLVTNLFNRVQPLIRFELTDLAAVEPEPCPCGRTLLRLRSLAGRSADVIRLGGVAVHPMQFGLITRDPDVREFQVVQEGEGLTLRVVLGEGANGAPTRLGEAVTAQLRKAGVAHPLVRVEPVDRLERSPAGKLQTVVADRAAKAI